MINSSDIFFCYPLMAKARAQSRGRFGRNWNLKLLTAEGEAEMLRVHREI